MGEASAAPLERLGYQLFAVACNIRAWIAGFFSWRKEEHANLLLRSLTQSAISENKDFCVVVRRPGGSEHLSLIELPEETYSIGFNIPATLVPRSQALGPSVTAPMSTSCCPAGFIIIKISHFSINYADVCIRWGLYESANKYVGWPIVPGFDVCGEVVWAAPDVTALAVGDNVFGTTLFGGYSTRVLAPAVQFRRVPEGFPLERAAAIPAVAFTALHACTLAGYFPQQLPVKNKRVLVHSAGGGVGSLLCILARHFGLEVTAVVGGHGKIEAVRNLGIEESSIFVKGSENLKKRFVATCDEVGGFHAIFDGNGGKSLSEGFQMLAPGGTLVTYGMHTILPTNARSISPLTWIKMLLRQSGSPRIDPQDLITSNKSLRGFNLSFMAEETYVAKFYFDKVMSVIEAERQTFERHLPVQVFPVADVGKAHDLISSGRSVGKLIISVVDGVDKKCI